ncbi:MAG: aminodeoxychorismate synthase component I [Bacteroidota bacterium]
MFNNSIRQFAEKANRMGAMQEPFFFCIDFEMQQPVLFSASEIQQQDEWFFNINTTSSYNKTSPIHSGFNKLSRFPISLEEYEKQFLVCHKHLMHGNSYLLNLTCRTQIEMECSLPEIFSLSNAKYNVLHKNDFVCFSPEIFIQIKDNRIHSFPMKGTIRADIQDAEKCILNDPKETAEHYTIVDLIRNDLSMVSKNVRVDRFRYIDRINTVQGDLLQVSSEISGTLPMEWRNNIGDILITLLPAGSVSGAPKKKTIEIIQEAEKIKRGYYCGIAGYFNGKELDSGVMIRFIEKEKENYFYRSGGGITVNSQCETEYNEMIDKVYVPFV